MVRLFIRVVGFIIVVLLVGCVSDAKKPEIDVDPEKTAKIYVQLGYGYIEQERYDIAKRKLGKALKLAPNMPEAHDSLAYLFSLINEHSLAEKHYQKALNLAPENSQIMNNYGVFLCKLGQFNEADSYFNKALANPLYTTPDQAYENAGYCALKANKPVKAVDYFEKALFHNPLRRSSLLQLIQINVEMNKMRMANSYLKRYLSQFPLTSNIARIGLQVALALDDKKNIKKYQDALATLAKEKQAGTLNASSDDTQDNN